MTRYPQVLIATGALVFVDRVFLQSLTRAPTWVGATHIARSLLPWTLGLAFLLVGAGVTLLIVAHLAR